MVGYLGVPGMPIQPSLHVKSSRQVFQFDRTACPKKHCRSWICFFAQFHHVRILRQKSQGRFKSSGSLPKHLESYPKKKRILRTPTMFRRLPGVLEDRAAIREIVLQNVEKKETAKALRALHSCPPRDAWWCLMVPKMLKFQSAQTRGRFLSTVPQNLRQDAKADIDLRTEIHKKNSFDWVIQTGWSGGSGIN